MGQEFHVLRCFSCQTFQVQQVKKSKKWSCKVCGVKQSMIKVYGQGSGVDCRRHVQRLNALRGEMLHAEDHLTLMSWQETSEEEQPVDQPVCSGDQQECKESRWSKYMNMTNENTTEQVEQEDEENTYMDRNGLHTQRSLHNRKRRRSWASVPRKPPGPTETCNQWKKAKNLEGEETNNLEPSMQTSAKTSFAQRLCSVYSTTSFLAPEDNSVFTGSSEKTEGKTSKWCRFLPQPGDSEADYEEDGSPAQCTNYSFRETPAQESICPSTQLELLSTHGMSCVNRIVDDGPFVQTPNTNSDHNDFPSSHTGAPPICQPGPLSKQPHPLFCSLFQTDEDFDISLVY